MSNALAEYREYADGTLVSVQDTGACCQDCGSRDVLKRYREYPDGTLVYVDSLDVCCGCATGTGRSPASRVLQESREYPDGTQVFISNTGACCDCDSDLSHYCPQVCGWFAAPPAKLCLHDFQTITGDNGSCTVFPAGYKLEFSLVSQTISTATYTASVVLNSVAVTFTLIVRYDIYANGACAITWTIYADAVFCDDHQGPLAAIFGSGGCTTGCVADPFAGLCLGDTPIGNTGLGSDPAFVNNGWWAILSSGAC